MPRADGAVGGGGDGGGGPDATRRDSHVGEPDRTVPAIALTVGLLALYNVVRSVAIPSGVDTIANVVMAGVVAGIAIWARTTAVELGLERDRIGAGLRWGGVVFLVVVVVMALVAVIPATSGLLDDERTEISAGDMAFEVLVTIPFGTVMLEELAFRGVLLGLLMRRMSDLRAAVVSSVLFGFWHVATSITTADDNETLAGIADTVPGLVATVTGTVLATGVAGLAFCWLRLRSGSLLAPAMGHWAVNGVTFAASWAANR